MDENLEALAELAKTRLGDLSKYETMIGCWPSQATTAHERRACMLCDATVYVHPTSLVLSLLLARALVQDGLWR